MPVLVLRRPRVSPVFGPIRDIPSQCHVSSSAAVAPAAPGAGRTSVGQPGITNEIREAAPRPRHHGVFHTRTPTHVPKMSAGITSPCGACIKQPARALALGTDRPAHAGQRNNHYAGPALFG